MTSDGLARLPGLAEVFPAVDGADSWQPPFALVAASLDSDTGVTLSNWMGGFGPWAFDLPTDWDGRTPKSLGLVFADRGVYRPGDTVFLKGLARYRELGKILSAPKGTKVQLRVLSSRGKEVGARTLALDDFGAFSAEVVLDKDVPLGTFGVTATTEVGGKPVQYEGSFRVEEYRAPQFKVDVTSPARDVAAGDALSAQVLARYLFGGAMAGAEVRWTVTRNSSDFVTAGQRGLLLRPGGGGVGRGGAPARVRRLRRRGGEDGRPGRPFPGGRQGRSPRRPHLPLHGGSGGDGRQPAEAGQPGGAHRPPGRALRRTPSPQYRLLRGREAGGAGGGGRQPRRRPAARRGGGGVRHSEGLEIHPEEGRRRPLDNRHRAGGGAGRRAAR